VGHPLFTPEYTRDVVRPALARGAERAGRDAPPPIAGYVTCWVDEDGDAARQAARAVIAFNSTVATYRPVLAHHGFDSDADRIREAWKRGDPEAMSAAVSDEMLEAIAVAGTPDEVRAQFARRRADLFERSLLWTPFGGLDRLRAVIAAFSEPASKRL
jgi:alkanesulfonate monooxygenase SsuD/methylene tetrahydromethanopterin reductase-like flavin-dependent oxidoreductase (luciferase family)